MGLFSLLFGSGRSPQNRKALVARKRAIVSRMQALRADYTHNIRIRSGWMSKWERNLFRSDLARRLAPLEREKQRLEAAIQKIDAAR
jgi:hypothetical protein